jgi:hypothetical protein
MYGLFRQVQRTVQSRRRVPEEARRAVPPCASPAIVRSSVSRNGSMRRGIDTVARPLDTYRLAPSACMGVAPPFDIRQYYAIRLNFGERF